MKTKPGSKPKIVKNTNNPVSLSSVDICKIIRQCRSSGVLSLSVEGLELYLGEYFKKPVPMPEPIPIAPPEPQELPLAAEKPDAFDKDELLELEAADLLITDPAAHEELMIGPDVR